MNRLAQLVPGRGALASPLAAGRESGRHAAVLWTSPRPLNQAAFWILGFLVQRRLVALRPVLRGVRAPAQWQEHGESAAYQSWLIGHVGGHEAGLIAWTATPALHSPLTSVSI